MIVDFFVGTFPKLFNIDYNFFGNSILVQYFYYTKKNSPSIFIASLVKGALSSLRQFLAIESPLKRMKNAFYFTSKALFFLKIFKFLS